MRPTAAREPRYARARKNTQNQAKKTSEIENFEEDRRRKYSTFIPTNSHDYRNDGDNRLVPEGLVALHTPACWALLPFQRAIHRREGVAVSLVV